MSLTNNTGAPAKCPHGDLCGGCGYNDARSYEDTASAKEESVRECFRKNGLSCDVIRPIVSGGAGSLFAYRNKMEYTFGDLVKGGPTTLGMHKKRNFMSIVTVDHCLLVPDDFNRILRATLDFVTERGYSHYNPKSHEGMMRNLIVRRGVRTGEILANVVTASDTESERFDEDGFADMICSLPLAGKVVGVLHTINDELGDAVKCGSLKVLRGRDHYYEELAGLRFKVSAFAFFQTNVPAAERMYEGAVAALGDVSGMTVFDLYCGTGTISQILARAARRVVGVEITPESVFAARENAKLNGLDNCEFICGDVFEVLRGLDEKPDAVIVDPPRAGLSDRALTRIASYGVPKIVYVSCNPKTLAPNLKALESYGYEVLSAQPYDNYAWTGHTETVALLTRKLSNAKSIVVEIDTDTLKAEKKPPMATYANMRKWIHEELGLKVPAANIAAMKDELGLEKQFSYEEAGMSAEKRPGIPEEKRQAIIKAFEHFGLIKPGTGPEGRN